MNQIVCLFLYQNNTYQQQIQKKPRRLFRGDRYEINCFGLGQHFQMEHQVSLFQNDKTYCC